MNKYPKYRCRRCGAPIGYVGRFFQSIRVTFLHNCEKWREANHPGYKDWKRKANRQFDEVIIRALSLPGFGTAAPATPAATTKGPDIEAERAAKESIARRNQGSFRRPEFVRKQRAALLLKEREEADNLA